jgi:hypothetical protein
MWRKLFSGFYELPKVSPVEGFLLRLFFAAFLIFTFRSQVTYTAEPHPKGLLTMLHWFGEGPFLTWLANPDTWALYKGIFIALLAVYVAGYALVVVTPALAVMHLLPFTLYASQGFNHHGNQIVTCTLIVQAFCVIWYSIRHKLVLTPPTERLSAWMLLQSQVILCGMYFISVFTKLDKSNGMWLSNSKYVAMDMLKTQRQSYLNELDPVFAGNPLEAIWMLDHPTLATLFFGSGLFLEFFCIFAIGNRLLGFLIGVSLIAMHRSIDHLMGGVAFLNNELLAFIFLVNIPFLIACVVNWLPKLRARHLAVAGGVAGIALSFWVQPQHVRTDFTQGGAVSVLHGLGNYLLKLINNMDTWNSFDPEQWRKTLTFVTPALLTSLACAVLGAVVGSFIGKGSGNARTEEHKSEEDTAAARTA